MSNVRIIPCEGCNGDGGFDVIEGVCTMTGASLSHWRECTACGGTGENEIELQEITLEDLETKDAEEAA